MRTICWAIWLASATACSLGAWTVHDGLTAGLTAGGAAVGQGLGVGLALAGLGAGIAGVIGAWGHVQAQAQWDAWTRARADAFLYLAMHARDRAILPPERVPYDLEEALYGVEYTIDTRAAD